MAEKKKADNQGKEIFQCTGALMLFRPEFFDHCGLLDDEVWLWNKSSRYLVRKNFNRRVECFNACSEICRREFPQTDLYKVDGPEFFADCTYENSPTAWDKSSI